MATVVRRRSSATVDWDAVAEVALPSELRRAGRDDLRPDSRLDGLIFEDLDLAGVSAQDAHVLDCRFSGCVLDEGRWRRARLSSCVLEDVRATALDVSDGKWSGVVVRRGRIGALEAHGATLAQVTVDHTRLDYVNLRGAGVTQVQFVGCRIGELDVGSAELSVVRFVDCQIGRLALSGCALDDVDLRGAELTALEGIGSLAGAAITEAQLARLAPALAAHLGITVSGPGVSPE
jgi:uncharacterized protein YjbI with pentapeptide repeats